MRYLRQYSEGQTEQQPYVFFLPPFFPLEIRLFLPTAMLGNRLSSLYLAVLALTRPPAAEHDGRSFELRSFQI